MDNTYYFLALNRIPQIGPRTALKLLAYWPSLEDMFRLSAKELEQAGLQKTLAQAICQFNFDKVDEDLRWQEKPNHFILSWQDKDYPFLLKQIHDPPIILYAQGNLNVLMQNSLAIVGSRKPSPSGSETAHHFAHDLSLNQLAIVSGLAQGIDAQAHSGCLAAGGNTIAVMGTGIDSIYPRQHRSLAEKISENGLVLTEFPLKSPPSPRHFPRRNRIISGLSLATLVVEAAIRSGSLITARFALEQNRDVLAIPGSILNPQARGCHFLLQQGAKLVTTTQDILEELNLTNPLIQTKKPAIPKQALAMNDENLVKCIGFEITTVDQVVNRSGLTIEEVACSLAMLELQGFITAVPGGYIRCS